jgi:uncharacterized protein (TIGR02996 family)
VSDADALLRAIRADPESDGPRLVYADWLQEHGDPDRAEFIRTQIESARTPAGDPTRSALERRANELLAVHKASWSAWLPELAPWSDYERGFVEQVVMWVVADVEKFVGQLRAVLAGAPVRRVQLHPGQDDPTDFDGCPFLPLEGLRAFAGEPAVAQLRALNLSMTGLHNDGAFIVAASPHLAGLEQLRMVAVGLGDEGARALAESPHLARLRRVDVRVNSVGPEGSALLRRRFGDGVSLDGYESAVEFWRPE